MKTLSLILAFTFAGASFAAPHHLEIDMTTAEYRNLVKQIEKNKGAKADDPAIREALNLGERLSKWIALVNTGRTPTTAIRLTSPQTRRGIPIDKPNTYSPSIIKRETQSIMSSLPSSMKEVLLATTDLPGSLPLDDETFIEHARKIDRNYQSAARYKGVDQERVWYIEAANKDVRGYYYLRKNNIGENELRDTSVIPGSQVGDIKNALAMICMNNTRNIKRCKSEVEDAFKKNEVAAFYSKHFPVATNVWNNFFKIPVGARRKDVRWSSGSATVPFNTPELPKFGPYLKDNIEDEFRWKGWGLKINFGRYPSGPYLRFEAGTVPHVNDLGGNEIVMDSNQPIEEYESQWTIRHEFGHVLGLPDCYHEFYDTSARAYVNYQLDITDLMCSRAGNMNERIFKELKEAYEK